MGFQSLEGEGCGLTVRRGGFKHFQWKHRKYEGFWGGSGVEQQGIVPEWCFKLCSNCLPDKRPGSFRKVALCQKPIK